MASSSATRSDSLAELYSQLKYVSDTDRHVEKELREKERSARSIQYKVKTENEAPASLNLLKEHIATLTSLRTTLEMYQTLLRKNVHASSRTSVRPLKLLDLPDGMYNSERKIIVVLSSTS